MKKSTFFLFILFGIIQLYSQNSIAIQSFETSGDTWAPLSFSTPECTINNDIWDYTTALTAILPNEGLQFWGVRDLDGSCGGNEYESITFPDINVSSFSDIILSFDYYAINLDNNEDLKYELFYDGVSQGEVIVVNGVQGNSDDTNGWLTEIVSVPETVTNLGLVLFAKNNDNNDRSAYDNVRLIESSLMGGDECINAETLIVGTDNTQNIVTSTNVGATDSGELPDPSCARYEGGDVWFETTVPLSGELTIETIDVGGIRNTGMAIYTGVCGNLVEIDCDNRSGSGQFSLINVSGMPGTQIFIRVWAPRNRRSGDFGIVAYSEAPLSNDDCTGAQNLVVGSTNTENIVTGTNVGATDSGVALPNNCDQYLGGDVWYSVQVPASGIINIETSDAGGISDTGIAVYTGSCGSLTQIDCDADSGPGFFSTLNLTGLANTTIYIRVWEYQNNDFGSFNIVAYSPKCPFTTTWNGSSWNNGMPNSFTSAIINGDYDIAINGNVESCNCTINPGNTINVPAGNYILIENDLTNNGILEIQHEGSLVMVNDNGIVTSTGTIIIHKTTTPYLDPLDYTYWSSPTINETFGSALGSSRPDRIFEFDIVTGWIAKSGTDVMTPAKGYLAGAPDTGTFPQAQSVVFDGLINNGVIQTPNFQDINFNWNLIGNPYPSAIDADLFLDNPLNTSIINGTIYLWTHNSPISDANAGDEKYNYSTSDYATYTVGMGGTAAASGGTIPSGSIASAQGFFIQGLTNGAATFNNSMRVTSNNNQFFKNAKIKDEKDRIWLNLYNNKGAFSQILIGFIEKGTNGIDRYDAPKFGGNYISFYSRIEGKDFAAQSKPTLKDEELIKLGLYSYLEENDSLKIGIEKIDGALTNYTIYLRDKLFNKLHDLTIEDYTFVPEPQSVYDDRFELIFTKSQVLDVEEVVSTENKLLALQGDTSVEIKTTNANTISQLKIYDLLGKTILDTNPNNTSYLLNNKNIAKGTILLLSVTLDTNEVLTKKIIIH